MKVVVMGPADAGAIAADCAPALAPALRDVVGYAARPTELLVKALLEAGAEVELITLSTSVTAARTMSAGGLTVLVGAYRPSGRARDLFAAERRQLTALLAQTEGGVVHAHWTYEFAWAALNDSRPRVVTVHDAPLTILRHLPTAYRAARAGMAYRVRAGGFRGVAVSPYVAGRWRRQMLDGRSMKIIPNIVSRPGSLRSGGLVGAMGRLVCVGDDGRLKNVRPLLQAFSLLRATQPALSLTLVGAGLAAADPLAHWARQRRLDVGVRWLGRLEHDAVLAVLADSDLAVHPSLEESFGMGVAEAMALGLPVVAGRCSGAVPWLLDGGRAGVLVDVRSPQSLHDGVLGLLRDGERARRIGAAAADRIRTHFSAGDVIGQHLRLYDEVVGAPVSRFHSAGGQR